MANRVGWVGLFLSFIFVSPRAAAQIRLINGNLADPSNFKEIVKIKLGAIECTATLIGPQVLITAAHCTRDNVVESFTTQDGSTYQATMKVSPLYAQSHHDIAVGIIDRPVANITPAIISTDAPAVGLKLTLLGTGCSTVMSGSDGKLRQGDVTVNQLQDYYLVSGNPGGAALCFGDDGGPAYVIKDKLHYLMGVHATGDLVKTNYDTRIDIPETKSFLQSIISTKNVQICGLNLNCGGSVSPPTCTLNSSPNPVQLGNAVSLSLLVSGEATTGTIDGNPVQPPDWKRIETPTHPGTIAVSATVSGPGGKGECSGSYTVVNKPVEGPPTCTLTATPSEIKLGQSLTLTLNTNGQVNAALINGRAVAPPSSSISITPSEAGLGQAVGTVMGPGGQNTCKVTYNVTSEDNPFPPPVPDYVIVPTYCGTNTVTDNPIKQACLATVTFSAPSTGLQIKDVFTVTYNDGSVEALPIINRTPHAKTAEELVLEEDLALYINQAVTVNKLFGLLTKAGFLRSLTSAGNSPVPLALRGYTSKGMLFSVDSLTKASLLP